MNGWLNLTGRILIAMLFLGGAVQKVMDPEPVMRMINSIGLPDLAIWPIAAFNLAGGLCLIFVPWIRGWALALAAYCLVASWFPWELRADPWQVTIMIKNWSIAGGLLILASQSVGKSAPNGSSR